MLLKRRFILIRRFTNVIQLMLTIIFMINKSLILERYMKVVRILKNAKLCDNMKNIVEFGCAELKFFIFLKNGLKHATKVDLVDIDGELVERFKSRIEPLICEHLNKRERPFLVNVWKGNVALPNPNFRDVDAVVAIEL